jgi:hypothetical protein
MKNDDLFSTDINSVVEEIMRKEPLITATKVDKVKELIESNDLKTILAFHILIFKDYKKKFLIKMIDDFIYSKFFVRIFFH